MDLQIEALHTEVEPELREWISERMDELNRPADDILHARVSLLKQQRHQKGSDEVRVFLALSGKTLQVTQPGDTIQDALYEALSVLTQELREFRKQRREFDRTSGLTTGKTTIGRIVSLFDDRDYGFIETDGNEEVYFHADVLQGLSFDQLDIGMTVSVLVEMGRVGPRAMRVSK
jgi:cold shock CspA family protein/ribosome-associated translation inhibitor RaiA